MLNKEFVVRSNLMQRNNLFHRKDELVEDHSRALDRKSVGKWY